MAESTTEDWDFDNRIIRHHSEFDDEEKGTDTHRLDTSSDLYFHGWQIFVTVFMGALLIIFCCICYCFCKDKMHRFRPRVYSVKTTVDPDPISNDFSSDDPATTAVYGQPMTAKSWKAITPKLQTIEQESDEQSEEETEMVGEIIGNADEGNENSENLEVSKESVADKVVDSISDEPEGINEESANDLDKDQIIERNGVKVREASGDMIHEGSVEKVDTNKTGDDELNGEITDKEANAENDDESAENFKETVSVIVVKPISNEHEGINEESTNDLEVDQISERNQVKRKEVGGDVVLEAITEEFDEKPKETIIDELDGEYTEEVNTEDDNVDEGYEITENYKGSVADIVVESISDDDLVD